MQYFIANWKMNMDSQNIKSWLEVFNNANESIFKDKTIIIAPSFPYLEEVSKLIKTPNTFVAAQDVDLFDKGAHTGSTGIFQIKEFCKYVIVGHSERKELLETTIAKRDLCIANNILPIVCFVKPEDIKQVETANNLVAWEDPQNISINGVYRAKDPSEVLNAVEQISNQMVDQSKLIYGGSVNKDNISDLSGITKINGVLVGNASLDPSHFLYIIENA
jgi:triosephosphate isomerase (TIM)